MNDQYQIDKAVLQYYALILSISQKAGDGDAFTRQYDQICRVLTKEQVKHLNKRENF